MDRFNKEMAMKYGIKAAVVAQFIWDSFNDPIYEDMVFQYDGRQWLRCSQLMMTGTMPYMSNHMVRDTLHLLLKSRILMKGCFNYSKFDRTSWYTFTDFGYYMMTKGEKSEG